MIITRQLCKAARALVDWNAAELAEKSHVSHDTIRSFESGRTATLSVRNQDAIRRAFASAGISFLENGTVAHGVGVALRELE